MQNFQQSLMSRENSLTPTKVIFTHGVGCSLQILEVISVFVEQGVKINTDLYTRNILVPTFEEMKNISKINISPSNKMEHHLTP